MGDIYNVQHLKSYAVSQLNGFLSALWKNGNSPSLILDIVGLVLCCKPAQRPPVYALETWQSFIAHSRHGRSSIAHSRHSI